MSKLYFTRHGQTIWNVEGKVCGATDIELTELGHKQAIELGERIKADKVLLMGVFPPFCQSLHIGRVGVLFRAGKAVTVALNRLLDKITLRIEHGKHHITVQHTVVINLGAPANGCGGVLV